MKFKVLYRQKNGERIEKSFEASDRHQLFSVLKEQGIETVIRIDTLNDKEDRKKRFSSNLPTISPKAVKFGFLIVILIAAGIAAFFYFNAEKPSAPEKPKKTKVTARPKVHTTSNKVQKAEVKPSKASRPKLIGKKGLPIETYGLETYRDERGVLRYKGGLRVYDPNRPSQKLSLPSKEVKIFKRDSENAIASIILHQPGDLIVGEFEYGDDFIKDFHESLSEDIAYEETDTEYMRGVKDAVKEIKKELKAMMDRGEDIAQAMNDARNDLRNLFMYRQEIMALVSEESDKEDSSDNDVEDIIKAANEMFREKGIKEIEDGEIVRWNLIMEQRRENAAKEIEVQ